jgi:hypothetical protein
MIAPISRSLPPWHDLASTLPPKNGKWFVATVNGKPINQMCRYDGRNYVNDLRHPVPLVKMIQWRRLAAWEIAPTWRSSAELKGVRAQIVAAINACDNGAYVTLDIRSARNAVEVCNQAIHTEEGHDV